MDEITYAELAARAKRSEERGVPELGRQLWQAVEEYRHQMEDIARMSREGLDCLAKNNTLPTGHNIALRAAQASATAAKANAIFEALWITCRLDEEEGEGA